MEEQNKPNKQEDMDNHSKKEIEESLFIEELKTLLNGDKIDFYEDENLILSINGLNFKDNDRFKFILKVLGMSDNRYSLMENILYRYDNEEYWDYNLTEEYYNLNEENTTIGEENDI